MFLFSSLLMTDACKKKCYDKLNPDCENYDPCYGKTVTKSQFKIEQYLGEWENEPIWIEADTVYATGNTNPIRFTATCDADSFIWKIGANTYYSKSFTLNFFPYDSKIPITLVVVNKNPNTACFPKDNGRDTLTRVMYTWKEESYWDNNNKKYIFNNPHPIMGYYEGYFSSNPTVKTIIRFFDTSVYCSYCTFNTEAARLIENVPNGYYNIDSVNFFSGLAGSLPFATYLGGNMVIGKNNKDASKILRIRSLARLKKDRKTINIKIAGFKLNDPNTTISDEFNGIKKQ